MSLAGYSGMDGLGLVGAVRSGQLSARDITEAAWPGSPPATPP